MNHNLDTAAPVRPGEELPVASLEAYLGQNLPGAPGSLAVEQFPHGHSNLTYLLRRGDQEFVLRRPPFGNQVKTAHDMGREFRVLSRLSAVFPTAPRPYFYCEDGSVLGAPFYVMERRRGVILRRADSPGLGIDPPTARQLSTALIDNLALLHALDYKAAGLADLGKPEGYVTRQVTGWINRYANARTDPLPEMDRIAQWLSDHTPAESGAALVHNDYKYDNLVLDPADLTCIVAVLDWEMATVGDPLMDLGTTLGYWVEPGDPEPMHANATGPTALPGSLTRQELVARYADRTGRDVSGVLFHYCFGLYKIAVIIQQIYARYVRGHTRDERFARLNDRVAALSRQALRAQETERL
ncbi:MAG TPA: phosphotransferase family protein [Fimbriiglobus sp.]|nr:phosphotransferase family protein [Fimbriiglobus sp.]